MGGGSTGLTDGPTWDAAALQRPASAVAPELLGSMVVSGASNDPAGCVVLRIVEVEAYGGGDDPASHAYRGPGRRNATMFGPPGRAYVYFTYGMHWCLNVVCAPAGTPSAVLLRAGVVQAGGQVVATRRSGVRPLDWARGPARLTRALGVDGSLDGCNLTDPAAPLRLLRGPLLPPGQVRSGPRVGVSGGPEVPWRFWVAGEPGVSAYRAGRPRKEGFGPMTAGAEGTSGHATTAGNGTDIVDELSWRGLLAQSTDLGHLRRALAAGKVTLYCGFDPTAASLHAGHLVPLLTLRRFQLAGHRPIALAGGATGMIGDPGGRTSERVLQTEQAIAANLLPVRAQLERFLDFDAGPISALLLDNLEWTAPLSVTAFLRDVGKHVPVNDMLDKETIRSRLASGGLSYTEFSYMLLQANDFLELYRRHGCRLQLGGSDQWGNITAGLDLIRRVTGNEGGPAHGMTVPLVTSPSGEKFGKSTGGGSLWLDAALTSPYAFFQYWLNVADSDVGTYLRLFSFLDRTEIAALDEATLERPSAREAQRQLAREMTTLVHGPHECEQVESTSAALFGRGDLAGLDERALSAALAEVPSSQIAPGPLPAVVDLLVATGLCASRGEARRAVEQGGAYVNNVRVADPDLVPTASDLLHGRYVVLRRGKRAIGVASRV